MKSWFSKASGGILILSLCGTLSSCALFGGGKYASQTEVETEVPDSLDQGKASSGPAKTTSTAYASSNPGVPSGSNLIDVTDPWANSTLPPLPDDTAAPAGGASMTGMAPASAQDLIDLPRPSFDNISVHNQRSSARMLSLGPPMTPNAARLSDGNYPPPDMSGSASGIDTALTSPGADDAEIAGAPRASRNESFEPAVPLLHGGKRLSDFYQDLHQQLLGDVVENQVPAGDGAVPAPPAEGTPSAGDTLSVPPPPPETPAVPASGQ